jgi:hypothetical protein
MFEEVFEIFEILIKNKKPIDESLVISAITLNESDFEECYKFILDYYNYNKNLSHTFWQNSIESFLKNKKQEYANDLIRLYPIKYSYSESLWGKIIANNMSNKNLMTVFNIFSEKYENRQNGEELKGYENIFNLFIENISNNL